MVVVEARENGTDQILPTDEDDLCGDRQHGAHSVRLLCSFRMACSTGAVRLLPILNGKTLLSPPPYCLSLLPVVGAFYCYSSVPLLHTKFIFIVLSLLSKLFIYHVYDVYISKIH